MSPNCGCARAPDRVVMIGTDPVTHGGISAAVSAWEDAGLFGRWPVTYIATHRDGPAGQKLAQALRAFATFALLLLRVPCAILHVHGASRASFWRKAPFMALALAARWPVVFHLHGGGFARFYQHECGRLRRGMVRCLLDRAACVVVVSDCWAAWVRGVVSHDRIACVRNAVALHPARRRVSDGRSIAFVGRLCANKGVFDLLDAFAQLRASHPEARLELAGEGDTEAVKQRARDLGVDGQVRLRGWTDEESRTRLLARAAVFALPSRFEASPMSLLEAMAAGCAVVASRVGGIPDIVRHEVNGLLVPYGDARALAQALQRAFDDPDLADWLGAAARATVARRHAPEAAVERIGRIYASLGQRPQLGSLAPLHRQPA